MGIRVIVMSRVLEIGRERKRHLLLLLLLRVRWRSRNMMLGVLLMVLVRDRARASLFHGLLWLPDHRLPVFTVVIP